MNEAEFVERLLTHWGPFAEQRFRPAHCIAAAGAVTALAEAEGLSAIAIATDALAANARAVGLLHRRIPAEEWPDGCWSVGVAHDMQLDGNGYQGHVVAIIGDTLVDLSAGQMARPQHRIEVGPLATDWWVTRGVVAAAALPRKGLVLWRLRFTELDWRDTPDWRRRHEYAGMFTRYLSQVTSRGTV